MPRGLRPAHVPQALGLGERAATTCKIDKVGSVSGPLWGRRTGPTCTLESYGIPHRPATAWRRRLTKGSCFGTGTRHLRSTQWSCYDEASGQRSTRRMGALDLPTLGVCTRAFVFNAQSTRAFMLNAHRASPSATAQPLDELRDTHGIRVLWLSLSYTPSLRLQRCPQAEQKVCVCVCVCVCVHGCMCACVHVRMCGCACVSALVRMCMCVSVCNRVPACVSVYMCKCVSVCVCP